MHSPSKSTKKTRRVSFAEPNPSNTTTPKTKVGQPYCQPDTKPNSQPSTPTPSHKRTANNNPPPTSQADSTSPPSTTCPPTTGATTPAVDKLAGLFTHTVTNTPHGLVIDGVLQPRGSTLHSQLRNPAPGYTYNPAIPQHLQSAAPPQQANMSSVAAGLMPDPNAGHYQPPVPDTTYGPFEYTYVPRTDPQYMTANGVPAGGPPFFAPAATFPYQQVQPQSFLPMQTPPVVSGAPAVVLMNASLFRASA
ncbi:hypothetical protein O1611_g1833 [Lasiodiplodia mahajangana]|uniref:Uncharacterized protein n=1 Tax=Lasiodiplodia mahajangana TaxID=1108764 RepID=A0ACC2JWL4_9PEZI|nr:hypothetical protein O1611_g1833 [Lasiodiplodia mahajangana]